MKNLHKDGSQAAVSEEHTRRRDAPIGPPGTVARVIVKQVLIEIDEALIAATRPESELNLLAGLPEQVVKKLRVISEWFGWSLGEFYRQSLLATADGFCDALRWAASGHACSAGERKWARRCLSRLNALTDKASR